MPVPEDHLVCLVGHLGVARGDLPLLWRTDLVLFLLRERIDWARAVPGLVRLGLAAPAANLFELAQELWDRPLIPGEAREELERQGLRLPVRRAFLRRLYRRGRPPKEVGHLLQWLFVVGVRARVRCLVRQLFPGREFLERRYGWRGAYPWMLLKRLFLPLREGAGLLIDLIKGRSRGSLNGG